MAAMAQLLRCFAAALLSERIASGQDHSGLPLTLMRGLYISRSIWPNREACKVRIILCAAVVAGIAAAPLQAQAGSVGATVAGGIIGGVAASIYASGAAITAESIGSAVSGAAASVPAAATGAAAVVAATSTPILVGVAGGGAIAFLLYNMVH